MPAPEILVVDDNPGDVDLIRESLIATPFRSKVRSVADGAAALGYLKRTGQYQIAALPDLVILDLNLPEPNGHKVLTWLKSEPELRQIPVVVFSSSKSPADIARSYDLGASAYVSKPADLRRFFSAVRAIEEFWFGCASLPAKETRERPDYSRSAD